MKIFSKKLVTYIVSLFLILGSYNLAQAGSHPDWIEIKKIKKEITELGKDPKKRKGLQGDKKWLKALKEQLEEINEEIKKEEELQKEIEAAKKELIKEIEALGEKPKIDTSDIDSDDEIIALRKQIQDIKDANKKKKEDADIKAAEKEAKEKKEQERAETIQDVRKEILFFGETPIAEYEFTAEDKYITALREQLEDIKKQKEIEEEKIKTEIPEWYINMPDSSGGIMYSRGTYTSMDLDFAENLAIEQAIIKLTLNLQRKTDAKIEIMMREAGVDKDNTLKQEMKQISKSVAKTVSINGYKTYKTKMSQLANGKFITFVVIEFPLSLNWQAYLNNIENNEVIKTELSKIKNTDSFKELEQLVAEHTGA